MNKIICLAFVLALVLTLLIPISVSQASGSTVSSSVKTSGFSYPHLRKSFVANGYEYAWYLNTDSNICYKSGNGTAYGAEVVVRAGWINGWSVATDGSKVAYVYAVGSGVGTSHLYWRQGLALGNGTISWDAAEQDITGVSAAADPAYTQWDSVGNSWIFYGSYSSSIRAIRNDNSDGTWSTGSGFPINIKASTYSQSAHGLYDVGGGNMVFVYAAGDFDHVHCKTWDSVGASLSAEASSTTTVNTDQATGFGDISAVAINAKVGIVFKNISQNLQYIEYNSTTHTFGGEVTLQGGFGYLHSQHHAAVIGKDLSTQKIYVWWQSVPEVAHMYRIERGIYSGSWGDREDMFTSSGFGDNIEGINTNEVSYGTVLVYYTEPTGTLKCYPAASTAGVPVATAEDATDVGITVATLNAYVDWDGSSAVCTMEFQWGGGGQLGNYTVPGYVHTADSKDYALTGLVPDNVYSFWVVVTNEHGSYYSNLQQFLTLPGTEPAEPIVTTMTVSNVGANSAKLNGHLNYDGGIDTGCACGFQLRIQGGSTWTDSFWNCKSNYFGDCVTFTMFYTNEDFSGTLTSLQAHTTYEVRAQAKNSLGTAYGEIETFTTGVIPGATVTPTTPAIPGLPGDWGKWVKNLSLSVKLLIALVVTVGLMIMVGLKAKGKNGGILVAAVGGACVVGFTVFGWYPGYVIIIIGGIVALLILLAVAGRGH